ncbi:hypothetical protein KI387_034826, partial [Taxus chinensis]
MDVGCANGANFINAAYELVRQVGCKENVCNKRGKRAMRAQLFMMKQAGNVRHWHGCSLCNRGERCAIGATVLHVAECANALKEKENT